MAALFIVSLLALDAAASPSCSGGICEEEENQGLNFVQISSSRQLEHPWPQPFGRAQHGSTSEVVPSLSSIKPAWNWSSPMGRFATVLAGGPVIDSAGNFYVVSNEGVHKVSPEGQQVWFHRVPARINNQVVLFGDAALGSRHGDGTAFALNISTGSLIWQTKLAKNAGGDSGYPASHDGVFVVGAEEGRHPSSQGGNVHVFGLDATSGTKLWQFTPEVPVWNLAPLFPGDDSTVFMDFVGNVYKLSLKTGKPLWKTMALNDQASFSDGGAILGSSFVYTCSNVGGGKGNEDGTRGALRAYGLSDGMMAWEQILPSPCNSYPAVGKLAGASDLSVVVTPGAFIGTLSNHGSVMAFDAQSGKRQWQYQCPVWHGIMARNDFTGKPCIPAHWSAPIITADGKVLAVRIDGLLYEVHDSLQGQREQLNPAAPRELDFETTPGVQAETFDVDRSSLHGAFAFAPKTMALNTCDSLFVFRY